MARGRLTRVQKLTSEGSKEFYEEIGGALYRYVADKSSVSPSGLTPWSIGQFLEGRSVPEELRKEFQDVLSNCEEARFTPGSRTQEEIEALRSRTEDLIVALERHRF